MPKCTWSRLRERTLDDLVDARIKFLSSRTAEDQIDAVPLVPKTKRRRWRLQGGPANVNEDDALLGRAIGEVKWKQSEMCFCRTCSTTSSSSNRKFSSEPSFVHITLAITPRRLSLCSMT